jgi:Flp pilus assembly protein TadD
MRPGSLRAAAFLQQGREHLNAGRYRLALAEFRKVKRLDPGNQDVNYLSGLCLEQMGQLELALEAYRLCESGPYASVAKDHARRLARKLGK